MSFVGLRSGSAGEVLFGEKRFVRAGLIGASFGWVWYVSAGAVCHGTLVYVLVFLVGVC